MKAATAIIILLVGSLFLSSCSSSISSAVKAEARDLANAGELFVAWTSLDNIPPQRNPDGTTTTTSFGSACSDCKAEIEIRFDKDKVDRDRQPSNQVGKWAICIHKSNAQLQEFLKLKRGDRVSFEYTDTPVQAECASGMYVKLVNPLKLGDKAKALEKKILNDEAVNETDLQGLSATELRILRNVNFARHGRKYDRPGLGDYFYNQYWYTARDDFKDADLTANDKANAKLIQSVESRLASSSASSPSPTSSSSSASTATSAASGISSSSSSDISGGPGETVKKYFKAVEQGDYDQLKRLIAHSPDNDDKMMDQYGRSFLSETSRKIKEIGGLKSINIQKEEINGNNAKVTFVIMFNASNKVPPPEQIDLVRENGEWKLPAKSLR